MSIRVALHHRTSYRYDRLVSLGPQVVRLRPAPHTRTPVVAYSFRVRPEKHFLNWQQDPYGNHLARLVFPEPTRSLELEVDLVVDLPVINPFDFFLEPYAETFPFEYPPLLAQQLVPFLRRDEPEERFAALCKQIDRTERGTTDFLVHVNQLVHRRLDYILRYDPGVQSPEETLEKGRGSCRDFALLLVQLLRHQGLAARFVSGYSIQLVADQQALDGPSGVAVDTVDLHAWVEAYLPGAGWVGLDATSGLLAGEGHIPLACSAEPHDASPISGSLDDCETELDIEMRLTRLRDDPRSTKPFSDAAWERLLEVGDRVDARLAAGDVRLTMGGEPTFVSIDDYVSPEWNTAAVGTDKLALSFRLIQRLRDRFAPGGFVQFGQGKWYPGESLPRWAMTCYWRGDGQPMWRDPQWLADPAKPGHGTIERAQRFTAALARRLEANPQHVLAAFEDAGYYLWREGRLPVDVDPTDPKLADAEERARIARVFQRGLNTPVGYVLPLQRVADGPRRIWQSGLWMLRARHVLLSPGDSPLGLRLPVPSLAAVHQTAPLQPPRDPFAPRSALPPAPEPRIQHAVAGGDEPRPAFDPDAAAVNAQPTPDADTAPGTGVRTALTVELREGRLHVFLPPVAWAEDFLDLVAAIEDTAASLQTPVVVEGYPAPHDPRLQTLKVTPDPGVIEVNVHPVGSWRELVDLTTGLYEDARQTRLGTEKFLVDGRPMGTGGGNHVVVGAATPEDSPFLRRPDLLRSLLSYWNNHPSLSYLFSSLFLGPTSQSPRIDEARHDALRELELAFAQLPTQPDGSPAPCPPWLVDRLFRHLLVDVSGNTHRAEFCIDKLYSPDSSSGRLGLLELRGFEMPPHARMSLAQQLLVRALIARFWEQPYRAPVTRWGTTLHDRFLLPHFVRTDFEQVLRELGEVGFALEWEWFSPQWEFRFPLAGDVHVAGMHLEVRHALEPWHVLGEEPGGGGTTRFVDSSLERLQVKLSGLVDPERYGLAVNGIELPLTPTHVKEQVVAGIRFRAWQPPSCLHPTIGVHDPLVFELHDRHNARAVGGCTYHVGHPGGRNYDAPPTTAYEAEGRRLARFVPFGHTPGTSRPRGVPRDPEAPLTLDLRQVGRGARQGRPE